MANNTPILSFLFNVRDRIIFQGSNAKTISMSPEYAFPRQHTHITQTPMCAKHIRRKRTHRL